MFVQKFEQLTFNVKYWYFCILLGGGGGNYKRLYTIFILKISEHVAQDTEWWQTPSSLLHCYTLFYTQIPNLKYTELYLALKETFLHFFVTLNQLFSKNKTNIEKMLLRVYST